jgi:hypothetical protein
MIVAFGSVAISVATLVFVPVFVAALTAIVTMWVTRAGDAENQRRQQYAEAVGTLVAWIEFPYRIRRRTDDEAATLHDLATIGHKLQERLALHKAWISAEHSGMADAYANALSKISQLVTPTLREAWNSPCVRTPAGMNLGEWGPGKKCGVIVQEFQTLITLRFGWWRVWAAISGDWRKRHIDAEKLHD